MLNGNESEYWQGISGYKIENGNDEVAKIYTYTTYKFGLSKTCFS